MATMSSSSSTTMTSFLASAMNNVPLHATTTASSNTKGISATPSPSSLVVGGSSSKMPVLPASVLSSTCFIGGSGVGSVPSHVSSTIAALPKKPQRPLTAYHIFFQIEREYVIQTTAGEDADKSIHDNKIYLDHVPQRYKNIKLLPDWYAGPGKRRKRKHRKQHGKIGFLDLSKAISTRWATLETVDSETKSFVTRIARRELDEYYGEMAEYKELTKGMMLPLPGSGVANNGGGKKRKGGGKKKAKKSVEEHIQSLQMQQQSMNNHGMVAHPEDVISSTSFNQPAVDGFVIPGGAQLNYDIDHFLTWQMNRTSLPSFKLEQQQQQQQQYPNNNKRKVFHTQDSDNMFSLPNFNHLLGYDNTIPSSSSSAPNYKRQRTINSSSTMIASVNDNNNFGPPTAALEPVMGRVVSSPSSNTNNSGCSSPANSSAAAEQVDICDDEILMLWRSHY